MARKVTKVISREWSAVSIYTHFLRLNGLTWVSLSYRVTIKIDIDDDCLRYFKRSIFVTLFNILHLLFYRIEFIVSNLNSYELF